MLFNGLQEHWSEPFQGRRVSVVYFSHSSASSLCYSDRDRLLKFGFNLCAKMLTDVPRDPVPVMHSTHEQGPAGKDKGAIIRNFVHGCCEKGSLMTRPTAYSTYCNFIEITKELDMRTREAIDLTKQSLRGPQDTFFWCSPCTGKSQRQDYNIQKAFEIGNLGTLYKIWGHLELHDQLKPAFFECAEHAISVGARVILEWPDGCGYWDGTRTQESLRTLEEGSRAAHRETLPALSDAPV